VRKVIFGWSAKCGCSHIKVIYKFLVENSINFEDRDIKAYNELGFIDDSYTIILLVRNPFHRLVSGFIDKYRIDGPFRNRWKTNKVLNF
jgi:hypothetical protein